MHVLQGKRVLPGRHQPMRERKSRSAAVFQVRRQAQRSRRETPAACGPSADSKRAVWPQRASQCINSGAGKNERVVAVLAVAMRFSQPLDELPIVRRKQFLFVRGAGGQFDDVAQRADFFAGARAQQMKLDGEPIARAGCSASGSGWQTTRNEARGVSRCTGR